MFSQVLLLLSVFLSRVQSDCFRADTVVAIDADADIAVADAAVALDAVDAVDVMLLTLLPFVSSALVRSVTIHEEVEGR